MAFFISKKVSIFLNTTFLFLLSIHLKSNLFPSNDKHSTSILISNHRILREITDDGCSGLSNFPDYKSKCIYVTTESACQTKGYINYLQIFYCTFGQFPLLGHVVLLLWLLVLFYLLGNTAADYFCSSLESLSKVLKLSPTIAGVTLLSLGNGAPDVFSSIVSFTRSSNGGVGLNSVLGGAFFVSSCVVGIISILISSSGISVDKPSFFRDVIFFLFSLSSLLLIILIGKINLWGAICFVAIYFIYVCVVYGTHVLFTKKEKLLGLFDASFSQNSLCIVCHDDFRQTTIPLIGYVDEEKPILLQKANFENEEEGPSFLDHYFSPTTSYYLGWIIYIIELPLYLPRRLTIPVVSEEKWSKPYAVMSSSLAPVLLAALFNTQSDNNGGRGSQVTYMIAGLIGIILGSLANVTTKKSNPPVNSLLVWLVGGFLMSVTWTYIIAEELVSLLISIGNIFGINPSSLGLTVLAWGNSLGDLIANVAMAVNGGADGTQIAISGCYAGPMFSTLVGLGISLVLSAWTEYPNSYTIPVDHSLYETVGFFMGGLLWALVILPKKKMKPDRFLGVGLLAIYLCFLFLRLARGLGILNMNS